MSGKEGQYARGAAGWSDAQYADGAAYLAHRAELVATLGPRLAPGDEVLDLACGDGGLGAYLMARGLRYRGVDVTPEMVAEAARRLGPGAQLEVGDLNDYEPPGPVAATTVFRAIYYARDRRAFLARVASFTTVKLVFDLNPRQYDLADVVVDLRAAGLTEVALRPFFVPQTVALPRAAAAALRAAERSGPLARAAPSAPLHVRRGGVPAVGPAGALRGLEAEADLNAERAPVAQARVDLGRHERVGGHLDAPRARGVPAAARSAPGRRTGARGRARCAGDPAEVRLLVGADHERPDLHEHASGDRRRRAEAGAREVDAGVAGAVGGAV